MTHLPDPMPSLPDAELVALRDSERRLRAVFDSALDFAIITLDFHGRFTSWSRGAEHLMGYAEAEMIGRMSDVIFTPEDRAQGAPEREFDLARTTGRATNERWHLRKDGSRFWGSGLLMLLQLPGEDAPIGLVKIMRDRTEARLADQALRDAGRHKDEFLATLAHELRNPLAPIRNAVQILQRLPSVAGEPGIQAGWALGIIDRQSRQMARLIDDLLDLSRIGRGQIDLRREPVELASVLNAALEVSRPLIESSGHALELALPAEPLWLQADAARLSQVFCNLLNNAAKYSERGARVALEARRDGDGVRVSVRDSGIGIPAHMLQRVFGMFEQIDHSLQKAQGGLGIGLTVAQRLVQMHGGRIEALSDGAGQGSEFVVWLPLQGRTALDPDGADR